MNIDAAFLLGWMLTFAFTILLFPKERGRSSDLLLLIFVAPLSFILLLVYRMAVFAEKSTQEPIEISNNEFIAKYKMFGTFHKLKIRNMKGTIQH